MSEHACHHCQEPIDEQVVEHTVGGEQHMFCCHGCAQACAWIHHSGLESYYTLRTEPAGFVGESVGDYLAFDRDDMLTTHSHQRDADTREITLLTDGMHCAACAWLIDQSLRRHQGVESITANAITGRIRIIWQPKQVALSTLLKRLAQLGYPPYLATGHEREEARRKNRNQWLIRLGIAGLGTMQTMMFAEALYLDTRGEMSLATRDFFRWITFLVASPVVFYSGQTFLKGAWRELKHRSLGMDTLASTAILLSYLASLVETIRGGVHVWFDASVMFVFLLLIARLLEARTRQHATAQVDALARAQPVLASREQADGSFDTVPLMALQPDDVVQVQVGEHVPADGVLLSEQASLDESLLTGESTPISKAKQAQVMAGSMVRRQPIRLRVTHSGQATQLAALTRLVEEAQAHKPKTTQFTDRIASVFVFVMLALAAGTYVVWQSIDPSRAFEVTLAVLAISCPCALSLATPTAITAAHSALSKLGVLTLNGNALDALIRVDSIIFDKTGTLTTDTPRVAEVVVLNDFWSDEQALTLACALEQGFKHPLAHAIRHAKQARASEAPLSDVLEQNLHEGEGISGMVDGVLYRLGTHAFACQETNESPHEPTVADRDLWLSADHQAVARFVIDETMRSEAKQAVQTLKKDGLSVTLSSGDAPEAVHQLADALGISEAYARQKPEDKLALVREQQAQGHVVLMVGDGINDAPVLAGADVSMAMASGSALAQQAADLVITAPQATRIPVTIHLAKRTRQIIRQNLAWALAYNITALPMAMAGWIEPWMAAIGMAVSSLIVTLNALRLTRS